MKEKLAASESVTTFSTSPGRAVAGGATVMLGRVARDESGLSRYGGVKICPSMWLVLRGRILRTVSVAHAILEYSGPQALPMQYSKKASIFIAMFTGGGSISTVCSEPWSLRLSLCTRADLFVIP